MSASTPWPVVLGLLLGCGDKDTGATEAPPPDVSGRYNVIVAGATGCDGVYDPVTDWAEGPLAIDETDAGLNFSFRDGVAFPGSVDATGAFRFGDTVAHGSGTLEVSALGSFESRDGRWVMSGDIDAVVDDDEFSTNNCTITARVDAYELISAD